MLDDHCTYRDTIYNYYFRQNRRSRIYPYQCKFGRKVVCLKDHEIEVEWIPYVNIIFILKIKDWVEGLNYNWIK